MSTTTKPAKADETAAASTAPTVGTMPLPAQLERLKTRLAAVTSGKAKIEARLKARPNSEFVEGWKKRLGEYEESLAGIPIQIAQLEFTIAKRERDAKAKSEAKKAD